MDVCLNASELTVFNLFDFFEGVKTAQKRILGSHGKMAD